MRPFSYILIFLLLLSAISFGIQAIWFRVKEARVVAPKVEPKAEGESRIAQNKALLPPSVAFRDVTKDSGVTFAHTHGGFGQKLLPETMGSGVLVFDFNQDGRQDVLFINSTNWLHHKYPMTLPPSRLALYQGAGNQESGVRSQESGIKFQDVTASMGLGNLDCFGMGASAGDIDNDGFPDLLITSLHRAYLFHNEQGKGFRDITDQAGIKCPGWSSSAAFLDYDLDGKLDLFVGKYVKWTPETDLFCSLDGKNKSYCQPDKYEGEHCQLFHNLGNGRFDEVSAKAGIQIVGVLNKTVSKCLGVGVQDYNHDGWPDVAVANDTTPNFLFRNNKDGTFTNVAAAKGVELINETRGSARGAMGIHWAYYRDGETLGLGIANFANEMSGLLRYDRANDIFIDCAVAEGVGGPSRLPLKFGLFFFDYDLDGRVDLFTSNGHIDPDIEKTQSAVKFAQAPQLFWHAGANERGCYREVTAKEAGPDLFQPRVGRGCAYGDLDNDGDLDIVLNNNNTAAIILRNDQDINPSGNADRSGGRKPPVSPAHSIRLRFQGIESNREGLGCRVKLWSNDILQQAELNSGGSYLSQSESILTFGLGKNVKAEKVEVYWPTKAGKVSKLENLEAGFTYLISESPGIITKTAIRR